MPKIGMCKSGGWHVILVAAAAFCAVSVVEPVLVAAPTAHAQAATIREIRVAGNRRVEPEMVRSYLKFNVGDVYDPGKVDQSIKSLFATSLFSDVRIDREPTGVLVTVVENPVINQVAFEGNSEADKDTLLAEVQLKPRSVFTRARAQADVQRILDVYRRQGRFAAVVDPKLIELDNNRVNVVFEINEGAATKVKAINFIGNRAFTDSQLRDIITTTQSSLFDFIKGTNIYDPDRLSLDRELLRQYYLRNGYADARIVSAGAELDRDGSGFYITFVIDEGEVFKFGTVEIESSVAGVEPKKLYGELFSVGGTTFNQSQLDKSVERLTLTVSEQGLPFARVRPRAARDAAGRIINVTYLVDEGPHIYIERINVIGNVRTRDYVIRREFRLAEGDAFNPQMVDKAKKRLQGLGFFKTVEIKRRPGSAPDRVILDVELVEQSTGELSFGAGYSTSEGLIGDVTISERNLLGRGQYLRLRLSGSAQRQQIDLSFTEPRFLDRNLAAGFDLFHKLTQVSTYQQFATRTTGASLRIGFPITEKSAFVGRAIGGHIEGWGGQDVRLLDLYYKGGETIRGFYMSGFGPRDTLTIDAVGGDTFWSTTAELRFPFPLLPDDLGMSGAVFADAGSLFGAGASVKKLENSCGTAPDPVTLTWQGVCLADSAAIRASVGFGILWNSPLGPLRLDIAKALLKESYDKEQLIRFGASTRF